MILSLILTLLACAPSDQPTENGECALYVDPSVTMVDGVLAPEACYEHTDDGVDYSLCCPKGWKPVGLTQAGEVVCL